MALLYFEQGETISFFWEARKFDGSLAVLADLTGVTGTGSMQRALAGGNATPDNNVPKIDFNSVITEETVDTGAGFTLTCPPATTIDIEPGIYVFEVTATLADGTAQKTQQSITIRAGVK